MGTSMVMSTAVMAESVPLTDQQLERVAAGTSNYDSGSAIQSSGGAIVGNSSTAHLTTSGDVSINDGVQQNARAVNLVNSAESGVANGVNVWDGKTSGSSDSMRLDVQQTNTVAQDQSRTASMPKYVRTEANVDHTLAEHTVTTHEGSVDTTQKVLGQEMKAGVGVSIAGQLDAHLTGGEIAMTNHIGASFDGSIKGSAEGFFTGIETEAQTKITADTDQSLTWTLPELTLAVKGAGCYVEMGKCDSSGSYDNTSSETTVTRSPFTLENAKAEYIVVDGSTLDASNSYSVALSGSAQSGARAVNLANAAGSVVANAVNVSRTPTVGPNLNLGQINTIVQRR
jgi:hypothetical protein